MASVVQDPKVLSLDHEKNNAQFMLTVHQSEESHRSVPVEPAAMTCGIIAVGRFCHPLGRNIP